MTLSHFVYTSIIIFLCLGCSASLHAEGTLSGEEILARMEKAKQNFYSYTQSSTNDQGTRHSRYSFAQSRPEGDVKWSESTVTTTSKPDVPSKKISITIGLDKSYEYYPDINIAADVSFQRQILKNNIEKLNNEKEGATVSFEAVQEITYDNAACYDVKKLVVKEGKTITDEHYIIDKATFLPRLYEGTIRGQAFKTEYQDIRFEPELTLDFFDLPEGVIVKTATNWEEFGKIMLEINEIQNPLPKTESVEELKVRLAKEQAQRDAERDKIIKDMRAGREARREAKRQAEIAEYESQQAEIKKKDSRRRMMILVTINVVVIGIIAYQIRHKFRKK